MITCQLPIRTVPLYILLLYIQRIEITYCTIICSQSFQPLSGAHILLPFLYVQVSYHSTPTFQS